jgi:hypothetical protein
LTNPGSTTCRPVPITEASRRGELGEGADLGDDAVALHDRAVVNLPPIAAVGGFGDDGETADNAGGHVFAP